ncbi:glycoside hydrolase family 97 protein [Sphingomonas sp. S2M10]|uniref:glycoside hydrolase family 97 protein n=1 Tax=Sphingomonas sp. S2M10 TaxID=2705010 RepID=UPI0014575244|nr:glycoside hydrolase family 97 protein [Sphingomonas sp. S2M10]
MMLRTLAALGALALAAPAFAQTAPATVTSPDGHLAVTVATDNDGRPFYTVARDGKPLVNPSMLGFLFTDAPKLQRNFRIEASTTSASDTSWDQPWGEWKTIRDNHRELRVRLKETTALGRVMEVVFRVFDDGVGFRYALPGQPNLKTAHILDEMTEFAIAQDGEAWWIPGSEWNRDEYLYNRTPISSVPLAHTPLTMKLADGTHIAIHEAALVDYAGTWLQRVEGTRFKTVLIPGAGAAKVTRDAPFVTPWRTMIIAKDAPGLYMSHIELNLNEANKLGDVSYFKPSKYVGVWWEMHLDKSGWGSKPVHGATTANVQRHIDFAAKYGFPGVLVEGWNVGWDTAWFGDGKGFDFDKPTPDFDAKLLADYASKKGVALIGHNETGGSMSHYESQLERAMRFAHDHGEHVVKTGYVADAGQIERVGPHGEPMREWHDGQFSANHHLRVLDMAHRYQVAIDAHEPIKDTGLRRTYPNWVSREGARGMEYNAWGDPKNLPNHESNLFFTRMLAGPMDFTPGVLSLTGKGGTPLLSTEAKQLALYVVLYSPVQMAADLPENYEKHLAAFQFIRDVAVDWEETRVLNGSVGEYVTVARKARGGSDWFLGAVGDDKPRSLSVPLSFLDAGKRYEAQIYRDGDDADYRTEKRHSIVIEKRAVSAADTLTVKLAPGGGQAIRFRVVK